ncbi:phage terminase large subunit [Streptomyces sp. SID11385]|uniref:phage terminase large subunit n=1 Tax=Streptomyces sp. SID11385 TaxID=2706031 RepID=UPI0013C6E60F|nr:phage terminase large subunit [Streptomyces sp. SID11385]NEA42763.1 terminase [Streptomyces sp. SID11385]
MNGTVVRYEPRGGAVKLLTCRDAEVLICGPAGTGKSLAMLQKLHFTCLAVPGLRALLVRQTHASLTGTTLVTFERTVVGEAIAAGLVRWFGGSARQPPAYRYANGSEILVGGLDRPEKFLSSEFDRIAVDEATQISKTAHETLITRLRGGAPTYKQIVCAANPAQPTHWLKQRADTGTMRLINSRHRDNPAYIKADGSPTEIGAAYLAKLDALSGVRRLRLRDGQWAAAEGMVYDGWDDAVHLVDPAPIPKEWPRWWVVDFGFTNPFVLQCWAEDPDGRLIMYREIYRTQRLVEDHARDILRLVRACAQCCGSKREAHDCQACKACRLEWTEPRPQAVICDHDAEDRATLERHLGLATTPAKKGKSTGIQAAQGRLKVAGDGRPRLMLMRSALVERDQALDEAKKPCSTEEEVPSYVWAVKPGGEEKEEPVKRDDHGMDAMRYMVAQRDLVGDTRVSSPAVARQAPRVGTGVAGRYGRHISGGAGPRTA